MPNSLKLLTALVFAVCISSAFATEVRITEKVASTFPDLLGSSMQQLPTDEVTVKQLAANSQHFDIKLPHDMELRISWSVPPGYADKVNHLGRYALQTWNTMMHAASLRTYPADAGWVSSANVERIDDRYSLVVYRFAKKVDGGKIHFETIVDVFGDAVVGSMKFKWDSSGKDEADAQIAKIIDLIRAS